MTLETSAPLSDDQPSTSNIRGLYRAPASTCATVPLELVSIEPDRRLSRIRLSDKTSRLHPRHVVPKPEKDKCIHLMQYMAMKRIAPLTMREAFKEALKLRYKAPNKCATIKGRYWQQRIRSWLISYNFSPL
jgi:hypothetical protein